MKRKICFVLAAVFMVLTALSAFAADERESMLINNNRSRSLGDFDFEVWRNRGQANMTIYSDGTFECFWDRAETPNILYRSGKRFNRDRTHQEIGDIFLTFDVEYEAVGNSSLTIYGWTVEPLVEYYIIESWVSYRPTGGEHLGEFEVDGAMYDVYIQAQSGGNILGSSGEFVQYRSVRQDIRSSGTVPISEHFRLWESLGHDLGFMNDVTLCVTGFNSTGSAKVNQIVLSYGNNTIGGERPESHGIIELPPEEAAPEPGDDQAAGEAGDDNAGVPAPNGEPAAGQLPGVGTVPEEGNSVSGVVGLAIGVPAFGAFCGFIVTRKPKRY
ncbi:MAG: glycoside hydrolase family 11 protein [Oscillospiraceae bacterium]|nr:glycoside hydrolase family 11 protein [Oscillospiraceae bacterium]